MRGIFKGAALKFPFFLVPFSFGNERKKELRPKGKHRPFAGDSKRGIRQRRLFRLHSRFGFIESCYHGSPASRAHGNISSQMKCCHTSRSNVLHPSRLRAPPSPLDRRSQWNLNRRSQCIEGKARVRSTLYRCKFFLFFPLRTISSRESATRNCKNGKHNVFD